MPTFSLRPVTDVDHEWLVELHNDPLVLKNNTDPRPITIETHMSWWRSLNPDRDKRSIFCVDGERVGFAKLFNIDQANKCCVLGGDIHPDFRGKRYARHMWQLMLKECFEKLKLHRVSLTVAEYNTIGRHLYGSMGFKHEGKLYQSPLRDGVFYDQELMFLLRDDWVPTT